MRVKYTASAAREFDEAVEYLLAHAPSVAAEFVDSIEAAIAELIEYPYSAQETEKPGVRRKYVSRFRYSIFYSIDVEAGKLVIVSVRHAARRWPWQKK